MNVNRIFVEFYKNFIYLIFKIIYGKIYYKFDIKNNDYVKIDEIILEKKRNFLYQIFKGRIFTTSVHDCAFIINCQIIEGPSYQYRHLDKPIHVKENFVIKNGTPRLLRKIEGRIFSILSGGASKVNYWHWLFDSLARFAILEKKFHLNQINKILVPSLQYKFQREALEHLGINLSKCLDSEIFKHISSDEIIATTHPYVFKKPSQDICHMPLWIIFWLRSKYKHLIYRNRKFPKKIYIDRSDSTTTKYGHRILKNEQEIKEFLRKKGFESIILSHLSFQDQVSLFNNCSYVIGLHGAGFANLIFCKKGVKILELRNNKKNKAIQNLSKNCNLNYSSLENIDKKIIYNSQQGDVLIDMIKLKKII
jgi:capsular polysaccharide biosynthesis protein